MTNDSPVFVDRTGTRRRWLGVLGVAGGALLTVAIAILVAGFLGGTPGHLPGLPDPRQAEVGPAVPGPVPSARGSRPPGSGGRSPSATAGPRRSAPVQPASPSPVPDPTRHRNAPPHPSPSKKR